MKTNLVTLFGVVRETVSAVDTVSSTSRTILIILASIFKPIVGQDLEHCHQYEGTSRMSRFGKLTRVLYGFSEYPLSLSRSAIAGHMSSNFAGHILDRFVFNFGTPMMIPFVFTAHGATAVFAMRFVCLCLNWFVKFVRQQQW